MSTRRLRKRYHRKTAYTVLGSIPTESRTLTEIARDTGYSPAYVRHVLRSLGRSYRRT